MWCAAVVFCGEFVVDCVVNVVHWMVVFGRRKTCQLFKNYFFEACAKPRIRPFSGSALDVRRRSLASQEALSM
jgi:hypothetical protein